MKSHDHHVFITALLSISFSALPTDALESLSDLGWILQKPMCTCTSCGPLNGSASHYSNNFVQTRKHFSTWVLEYDGASSGSLSTRNVLKWSNTLSRDVPIENVFSLDETKRIEWVASGELYGYIILDIWDENMRCTLFFIQHFHSWCQQFQWTKYNVRNRCLWH